MKESDFTCVFPYLNAHSWDARTQCLTRPLLAGEGQPCISYGHEAGAGDSAGLFMISLRTACEDGYTVKTIEPAAIKNLAGRADRPAWQVGEVPWQDQMRSLYWRSGDDLTASDVLDEAFLLATHALLDCDPFVLAIPTSTSMMACAPDMAAGLAAMTVQRYADLQSKGEEALMSGLLTVAGGKFARYE